MKSRPIYDDTAKNTTASQLYNKIKEGATVVLSQNMRTSNQEYTALQEKLRLWQWDDDAVEKINARVNKPPEVQVNPDEIESDYCPIICCTNDVRLHLTQRLLVKRSETLQENGLPPPILVVADFKPAGKKSKPFNNDELIWLSNQPDNVFSRVPSFIALYPGAYVLITTNINVQVN